MRRFAAGLAVGLALGNAQAQTLRDHAAEFWDELKQVVGEGQVKRLRIEYENDVLYATDRNYTNGVRLTWRAAAREAVKFDDGDQQPWIPPLRLTAGGDARRRAEEDAACRNAAQTDSERRAGRPTCYRTAYNFVFLGHNLYSPSDIRLAPERIPAGDRPYAAWAYIGFHREIHASDGRYWRYGLDIGCVGPCAFGRQLQTWVHEKVTNSPVPAGWDSQVRNEFGAVARFEYARRIWREPLLPLGRELFGMPLFADLRPHVQFGVGNIQTYAGAGATARIGWFRTSYDTLRLDSQPIESLAGGPRDRRAQVPRATRVDCEPGCDPSPLPEKMPEIFAFARVHADVVAYNALLQGGLFNGSSPKTAPARPLITEREIGIAGAIGEFSLSFSVIGRAQWDSHGGRFGQRFGRVALEFSTRF